MLTKVPAAETRPQSAVSTKGSSALFGNAVPPLSILLVEDDASDAEYIRILLDECDTPYVIERLKKGTEVLPYLSQKSMDLLLLDLGLPCLDGFEVLAELTAERGSIRNTSIVILTGYEQFMYLKNSYMPYIFDYITKPCSVDDLRTILLRVNLAKYQRMA